MQCMAIGLSYCFEYGPYMDELGGSLALVEVAIALTVENYTSFDVEVKGKILLYDSV